MRSCGCAGLLFCPFPFPKICDEIMVNYLMIQWLEDLPLTLCSGRVLASKTLMCTFVSIMPALMLCYPNHIGYFIFVLKLKFVTLHTCNSCIGGSDQYNKENTCRVKIVQTSNTIRMSGADELKQDLAKHAILVN